MSSASVSYLDEAMDYKVLLLVDHLRTLKRVEIVDLEEAVGV